MKPLIVGYGNPLRGDDALGQAAVSRLPALLADSLIVHQLTPELALTATAYERLILVDAREGEPVGALYSERVALSGTVPPLVHHLSPGALLTVMHTLYDHRPEVTLTGLLTTHFEVGAPLSEAVEAAFPDLVAHIERLVAK